MKKLKFTAIISGILTLLQLLPLIGMLALKIKFSLEEASAIGIIGSADGPTAVYVATKLPPLPALVIAGRVFFAACLLTFMISIVLLIIKKHKNGRL